MAFQKKLTEKRTKEMSYEENTLKTLPNYLIFVESSEGNTRVMPANSITEAIELARLEKRICSVFQKYGTMGKYWNHLCDISKGVF